MSGGISAASLDVATEEAGFDFRPLIDEFTLKDEQIKEVQRLNQGVLDFVNLKLKELIGVNNIQKILSNTSRPSRQ